MTPTLTSAPDARVLLAVTDTGAWAPDTQYDAHDLVEHGGTTWLCSISHTSASTFDETKFTDLDSYRGALLVVGPDHKLSLIPESEIV